MLTEGEIALIDAIDTPVFVLESHKGGEPVYIGFNKCALDVSGFSRANIIGKTAKDVYPGTFGEVAYSYHAKVAATRQPLQYELTLPLAGEPRIVRTSLVPQSCDAGETQRIFGTSSAQMVDQNELKDVAAMLAQNERAERFVSLAAHDLRSPLGNIKDLADMIREDFKDLGDGKLELLGMLENIAATTTELLTDILFHAQATDTTSKLSTFDLLEMCHQIFDVLDPNHQHELSATAELVTMNKASAQIVIRNLLDNAIKHSPEGKVRIEIVVSDLGNNTIQIKVTDDGQGFPDPKLAFFDDGRFKSEFGFGLLGLQRLVTAQGGTIAAENQGNGATVCVTLPGVCMSRDVGHAQSF